MKLVPFSWRREMRGEVRGEARGEMKALVSGGGGKEEGGHRHLQRHLGVDRPRVGEGAAELRVVVADELALAAVLRRVGELLPVERDLCAAGVGAVRACERASV